MNETRTRHLIRLAGKAGGPPRYYWQPSTPLRRAGWRPERLPDDPVLAHARAEKLNSEVDAWRRGELPKDAPAAAARRAQREAAAATPGTVSALIADYRRSRFWMKLADKTKIEYQSYLDVIEDWAGPEPVAAITPPVVEAFYDAQLQVRRPARAASVTHPSQGGEQWMPIARYAELRGITRDAVHKAIKTGRLPVPHRRATDNARGTFEVLADPGRIAAAAASEGIGSRPAAAGAAVRVLRLLLQVGIRFGYITGENPASRPAIHTERQREPQLWSPAEVRHMAATADSMGLHSIGTAILLNEWIGQREEDVLKIRQWRVQSEALRLNQGKTRRNVILPVYLVPHLVERLRKDQQRQNVVMSTEWLIPREGTAAPWSTDAFRYHFAQVRTRAAETMPSCRGLRFAELRHTAVTRLHEAGATETHISGITGHSPKTVREIIDRHYVVRTEKAAVLAFRQRLEAEREEDDGNARSGQF